MLYHWIFCFPRRWDVLENRELTTARGWFGNRYYLRCRHCGWVVQRDCR